MNAWVFRHLDELQRIYGDESASDAQQGVAPGCVQVLDPVVQVALKPDPERSSTTGPARRSAGMNAARAAGELIPGSVIRCETEDGPDVILAPAKRQHRPRR